MRRQREALNPEVAEIVAAVMGDLSLEQAAIHLNYQVGREGLRLLKRGKIGRETTIRDFARGFFDRLKQLYGDQIQEDQGALTRKAAEDWLARKAGFSVPSMRAIEEQAAMRLLRVYGTPPQELAEWLNAEGYLTPDEMETLAAIVDAFLAVKKRQQEARNPS